MATRYLVSVASAWNASNTAIWSASSGGAPGASAPAITDDVVIDANSPSGTLTIAAGAACAAFTCTWAAVKTNVLSLSASFAPAGVVTINGNSAINRILVQSSVLGTPRTFTAGSIGGLSNVDFMDIAGAGAAAPFTGTSLGDCLGNSGITFTPSATQTATGTASFAWSTHGWTSRPPLPQDDVVIPNAFVAGRVITMDMPRAGRNITFSCTGNPALSVTTATSNLYGSLALAAGMTTSGGSGQIAFFARSPVTFQPAGVTLINNIVPSVFGSTLTLQGALTQASTTNYLYINLGGFVDAGYSVTVPTVVTLAGTTTTKTGNWTLTGSGTALSCTGAISDSAGYIKLTDATTTAKTFAGGGKTYNNVWFASSTTLKITGSNTFSDFKADPGAIIQVTAGTTQTAATYHIDGRPSTGTDAPEILFDGSSVANITSPHSASHPTGDMSLVVAAKVANHNTGLNQTLVGKYLVANTNSAWMFELTTAWSTLRLYYTVGGVTYSAGSSAHGLTDGAINGYGVKRNATTGSITFYKTTDFATWTAIGTVAGTAGALDNPAINIECGAFNNGASQKLGGGIIFARVYSGDFFSGSPTLVADMDPSRYTGSGQTFTASTGEVWTRNGNAQFTATNLTTIMGVTNAAFTLAKSGGGVVACRDLSLRNATASPVSTFYAGARSYDGGGNTNWTFNNAPATADASVTQGANTLTSAAANAVAAVSTTTQAANTGSGASTSAIAADAAQTQGGDFTITAVTSAIVAASSATQGADTLTATAANAIAAVSSTTQGANTETAAATAAISAVSSVTQAPNTETAAATSAITAAAAQTQGADTVTAASTNAIVAAASQTQGANTISSRTRRDLSSHSNRATLRPH